MKKCEKEKCVEYKNGRCKFHVDKTYLNPLTEKSRKHTVIVFDENGYCTK